MKTYLFLVFFCLCTTLAFAQNNTDCIQRLKDATSAEKRSDYLTALRIYTSARSYCTGNTVDEKIEAMFKKIDGLRKAEERAKKEAEQARQVVQAVLDKIYFYNDRYGLAYDKENNRYSFIDRDLHTKIAFQYDEALPFDYTGYAKVRRYNEYYLIDTLGEQYPVVYDVARLETGTQALDLRSCQLDSIPAAVFQHVRLKVLLLNDNRIRKLSSEIGQLSNLQYLSLAFNQLTSLLPEIGQLINLQSLDLSANQLSSLPVEVGQLRQLQSLNLWDNLLNKLPPEMTNLNQLRGLNLGDNQLSHLPREVERLDNLRYLDLSGNPISLAHQKAIQQSLQRCRVVFK